MCIVLRSTLLVALSALLLGATQADGPAAIQAGVETGGIAFMRNVERGPLEIYVMNADGSGERFLARGLWPRWSPDGTRIAFVGVEDPASHGLYVINRDGSGLRRLAAGSASDHAWSPDGREIAFSSYASVFWSRGLVVVDVESGVLRQLTHGVMDRSPAWSPRGRRVAFVRSHRNNWAIATVDATGSQVRVLTRKGLEAESPQWSPDGRRIVFQVKMGSDIWVMNGDGSEARNLTHSYYQSDGFPRWSPTGERIAFQSSKRGRFINQDIRTFRWDGTGNRNLTRSARFETNPAWSPDGRDLVLEGVVLDGVSGDTRDIYMLHADGRNMTNLTNDPVGTRNYEPVWSP
jgi:TolB protein